jgi:pentatricopeptide repeat protein
MRCEGITPDGFSYVSVLKAYFSLKDIGMVFSLHDEISQKGCFSGNPYIGSALVNIYAKCGFLEKAKEVFEKLPSRNVVIWNALLTGYVEHELFEESLEGFKKMQSEGIFPDAVTYVCILKSLCNMDMLGAARDLHAEIVRRDLLFTNPFLASALIDMYVRFKLLGIAMEVFDLIEDPNVVVWTALIVGYVEHGRAEEALNLFEQMKHRKASPDATAFLYCLKACADIGAVEKGRALHLDIEKEGFLETDMVIGNALVSMYVRLELLIQAQVVFDKLPVRNVVTWTTMISGYAEYGCALQVLVCIDLMQYEGIYPNIVTYICSLKACGSIGEMERGKQIHGSIEKEGLLGSNIVLGNTLVSMYSKCGLVYDALKVFSNLSKKDTISWNTMIGGFSQCEYGHEALKYLEKMQLEGFFPDAVTYACSLKACSCIGATRKACEIHAEVAQRGILEGNLIVGSTLVEMYAKCGSILTAREVLKKLPVQDIVSWNSLLVGYAHLGECEKLFYTFDKMIDESIKPDPVTFLVVLNACSRVGHCQKSQTYFAAMSRDYGMVPTLRHHGCVIDLFGRWGRVKEAVTMIERMPFAANLAIWNTVLGACRNLGKEELGKQAFANALQLDAGDSAAYVLMSHIVASSVGSTKRHDAVSA